MKLSELAVTIQNILADRPNIKVELRDGTLPDPIIKIAQYLNTETDIDKDEEYVEL